MTTRVASWNASLCAASLNASSTSLPASWWVNHAGRGYEPTIVVGSRIMPREYHGTGPDRFGLLVCLHQLGEPRERGVPALRHPIEVAPRDVERLGLELPQPLAAAPDVDHEPGLGQHREV